jgi:hypothetical protein
MAQPAPWHAMKLTAKILKFKGKKLETVEDVRAALIAILEDIQSVDATMTRHNRFKKK